MRDTEDRSIRDRNDDWHSLGKAELVNKLWKHCSLFRHDYRLNRLPTSKEYSSSSEKLWERKEIRSPNR